MSAVITDELANEYSFTGRKQGSKSFKANEIVNCIYSELSIFFPHLMFHFMAYKLITYFRADACRLTYPSASDDDIKGAISSWLDASNTRLRRSKE